MSGCAYLKGDECLVASQVAGMTVTRNDQTCRACQTQASPRTINKVTTDIAVFALRRAGENEKAVDILKSSVFYTIAPESLTVPGLNPFTDGVGKTFADLADWIDLEKPGCLCRDYIGAMNLWGPAKCLEKRPQIVAWLLPIARKKHPEVTAREIEQLITRAAESHGASVAAAEADLTLTETWPFVWTYWAGGAVGDELRYSIRSVLTHRPEARVVVVGDKPAWYKGEFIRCPRISRRPHHAFKDCYHKLLTAARQIEQFVWMMDDVYWIAPFEMREAITPKYVRHVTQQRYYAWKPKNAWARTRAGAYEYLLENNLPTYDFAAHLPQPIVAETFLAMEERLKLGENYRNWECIYFNSHWSSRAEDYGRRFLRVTTRRDKIETRHKLLNHIHSQFRGAVEEFLAATFPNPSPVEQAVEHTAANAPLVTA